MFGPFAEERELAVPLAEECRALAKNMAEGEQRDQLLEMARTWDKLAEERSALVQRHPELALAGEHDEERRHS